MSKIKIFNDPIYGLVSFPYPILYDLIDHPYFQRLRRIQQLGMSSIVYPGATHTRFHHALGALHLCDQLISNLKKKGVEISEEEGEATMIAVLLHDIGHGPYSHALESLIIPDHHEELTLRIMHRLNDEFDGKLALAISIFNNAYERPFLHQMISGQVDVDRMDYLNRDSFYTGVAEGIIGYDRIIKMMNVVNDELVVEEKGILSIEKFLLSRHFMYHQVYLHKAALTADHMLKSFFELFKEYLQDEDIETSNSLGTLLKNQGMLSKHQQLSLFLKIDDSDIIMAIKSFVDSDYKALAYISKGILNRKLFGIKSSKNPLDQNVREDVINEMREKSGLNVKTFNKMVNLGCESSILYHRSNPIKILRKEDDFVVTFEELSRLNLYIGTHNVHFITYPKVKV